MRKIVLALLIGIAAAIGANAQIYNNFIDAGKFALNDQNYPLARYFFEEAYRQMPADSVYDVYRVKNFLCTAYESQGEHQASLKYRKDNIRFVQSLGKEEEVTLINEYLFTAETCTKLKDNDQARCYVDSALQIVNSNDLHIAYQKRFAMTAGVIYSHIGNWEMAESLYELGVMISRKFQPSDDSIMTLNLYGNVLHHNNKNEEALKVFMEQRDICEKLHGKDSREYQWVNYAIANTLAYLGRIDEGARLYLEVMGWYRDKMLGDLKSLPSLSREQYLSDMIDILQNTSPFGIEAKYNEDEFTEAAYEQLLLSKGLLLAIDKSTETIIREKGTEAEKALLSQLKEEKGRLADLLADRSSDPKDVINTYARIKTIYVQLANACADYGNNTEFAAIGYEDIRRRMKEDEVLLDFNDFKPKSKPRQYVCYEIRKDQRYPKVHYICNGAELDSLLQLEKGVWFNLYSGESGEDMSRIIGSKLKEIIGDAKRVYYVPSGMFHKLAIEAIPDGESRLGDSYRFCRLSSARELAVREETPLGGTAELYGGLTYCEDVKALPRSLKEVTEISATMSGKLATQVKSGEDGTKESLTSLSGDSPSILHVSTHGFYYSPTDRDKPSSLEGYNDAMDLSGLVMSRGSMATREGLLTAEEVSRCDLSHTSIACLASCHSGEGEVTAEGIYGMQRALKKAGVRSMVLSLWEASDVATEYFMTCFYSDLMEGSKDRQKAFIYARDRVREKYPSPYYWAGFVMVD
ncbi:MAG: CHAT domain-containing protein [Lepagella sp.]